MRWVGDGNIIEENRRAGLTTECEVALLAPFTLTCHHLHQLWMLERWYWRVREMVLTLNFFLNFLFNTTTNFVISATDKRTKKQCGKVITKSPIGDT